MLAKRLRAHLTLDRILDVATRRIARDGYGKTSLSDIARDLGVVKGALYYYLPGGKRDLIDAGWAREDERMHAAMLAAADAEPDPRRALVAAFRAKLETLAAVKDRLGAPREVTEEIRGLLLEREREFARRERALVEGILARGEAAGVFRAIEPRSAVAPGIQALVRAIEVSEMYEDRTSGGGEASLLDGMIELVLRGVEVRTGGESPPPAPGTGANPGDARSAS